MTEVTMRERKKEATKFNILAAAIELIESKGFVDTTMQAIAQKADVALRTLYNYFPTKESIVAKYIRSVVEDEAAKNWHEMMKLDSTFERLLFISCRFAEWSEANTILTEVYASDPRNYCYGTSEDVPRSGLEEIVTEVLKLGQEMGDVTRLVHVEVLTRHFIGVLYINVLTWLGDHNGDIAVLLREGLEIFYNGISVGGRNG